MHLAGLDQQNHQNPTEFRRGTRRGRGDLTVWERQGLPQSAQMRLRTASVDSAKLVWEVASACACASSTLRSCTPQSPHRSDSPAIAASAGSLPIERIWGRKKDEGPVREISRSPLHEIRLRSVPERLNSPELNSRIGGKPGHLGHASWAGP